MSADLKRARTALLDPADFLWAVGSLCNLRRKPFDPALVQREFPPPHTALTIVEALRALELDATLVDETAQGVVQGRSRASSSCTHRRRPTRSRQPATRPPAAPPRS